MGEVLPFGEKTGRVKEMSEIEIKNKVSFEEELERHGSLIYTNVGTSMMPLIRQGKDVLIIEKKKGRCRKYDVVLYKRGNRYILHRILKVTENGYVIAGDHNTFLEYDIKDEHIIGVLTALIRDGKRMEVTDLKYIAYVHLWCDFYPIRVAILYCKRKIWQGLHLLFRLYKHIKK